MRKYGRGRRQVFEYNDEAIYHKTGVGNSNSYSNGSIVFYTSTCFRSDNITLFQVGNLSHNLFYYVSSRYKVCWTFDRFDFDIDVNKETYF